MKLKKYSYKEWKENKRIGKRINKPFWWIQINGWVRLLTLFNYSLDGDEKSD